MQKRVMFIAILLLAICNKIVADDQLTASDVSMYPGDSKEVSVVLTNEETYVGFQFDLYLPDGLTVESFSGNSNRLPEGTTPQMAQQSDGSYRFIAAALGGNPIAGNDGPVLTLTLKSAESIAVNDYTGYLRNVKISKADGSGVIVTEQPFTVTIAERPKVADVQFAQEGNVVALSTTTANAKIFYTLSNNDNGEQEYTAPLTMTSDCTIEAWATRDGYLPSDTTSFVFHAGGVTCSNPVFARNENVITISTLTDGASIYYTTDGTDPTEQSMLYSEPIAVDHNMTIKAIAMRQNYYSSQIETFVVDWFKCEMPEMAWIDDQMIATTTTDGAIIQYTLTQPGVETPLDQGGEASPLKITVTQDVTITLYAVKTGWANSDTLVVDYPYTAWQGLVVAIDSAMSVSSQAANNDNVPAEKLDSLHLLISAAQASYAARTNSLLAIQQQTYELMALTDAIRQLVNAVNEPYVVLSDNNTVLTFYYDKKKDELGGTILGTIRPGTLMDRSWNDARETITTVSFDASMAGYTVLNSTAWWFTYLSKLTTINGLENLKTDNVTDMAAMFEGCSSLETIDLSSFNTANVTSLNALFSGCTSLQSVTLGNMNTQKVTDMRALFYNCPLLTTLDLSSFVTPSLTSIGGMFYGCTELRTIMVGNGWNITNIGGNQGDKDEVFAGCTSLVGGMFTAYDSNHIDATYAHIDGGTANPGYFTPKNGYGQAAIPTFTHEGNLVFINSATEGATIRYTIDGEAPTDTTGIVYSDSIRVTRNCTICAIAVRENFTPSEVAEYNVDWFKCEMPTIISWSGDTLRAVSATEDAIVNCILRFTSDGPVAQWSGGPDPQLTLPIQNDLYVELFATKEGWMTSDTLKFYYPYTAWHQLTDAINDANTVLAAAANNDNVTDADRNALGSLIEAAQQSYAARTETESAVKARTDELVAQTAIVRQLVEAVNEPYAVLSENNTVLTFYYDKKKDERGGLDIGPFNNGASGRGWHEARNAITTVKFDDSFRNETTLTSTAWWFSELTSLTAIEGLTNLNTSNVTDMWGMFEQCSALTSLDLSNFDTRKVEKMAYMFDGCRNLRSLDVSGFNTENVSEMGAMFQNCLSLPSLNVTNFNTANNRSMWGLFNGLTVSTLDLSSFNTAKVNDMGYVFANCSNLRTIFVGSGWTTQSVAASEQTGSVGGYDMFAGCINLVGGAGTTFDPDHVNELYAHVDGGPENPGYFTDINSGVTIYVQASEAPYLYAFDADGNALNGQFPGNLMTDTATVNGQLFYKTRIYRSVPFNINIIDKDMYRTREIYVISDRYFVYEGTSKYVDVTNSYGNAPEIQISSLALPGNHNNWDKMQLFEVVEAGKKYSMEIDLGGTTYEDNLFQFKLYANACAWLGITSLVLDAPDYVHSIGNPELIASDRNIVIDLASAPTREFKFEATWNGGYQMEEGWTLKITEVNAVDEPYAVLTGDTISGMTLTFYYDKKKEERNGMGVGPFTSSEDRGWHGNSMPSNITTVVFDSSFDNYRPTSTAFWFTGMHSLTAIVDIQYLQTQNVTNMNCMFYDCNALTSLDVTGFNTQNVTDMGGMFWGCSALTSLDVTGFNTQNVTDMGAMFRYCSGLTSLDVTGFNTQNATYMGAMFWGCSALTSLDVTDFNTQNVTNMGFMFYDCFALTSIDVTGFNTQNVTYMESMFDGCSALTSLNLLGLNTENVTNMGAMFARCKGLTSLDLSHFDTQNVTNMSSMFWNCPSLTAIYVGSGWTTGAVTNSDDMFSGCTSLVGGKGTAYDATHVDHTYAHIDGGPSNPGYFTDKNAPVIDYAYDGTSGVLTISGGTTMAEALEAAGGREEVAKTLTSIIWNNTTPLTNSDLQGLDNPNMLIYVQSDSLAPTNRDNVVVNGFAKNIVLTDVAEGNGDFYCPQAFTAEMISYTHEYRQQTEVGVSRGWETIAMPFTVQTIMHEKNGLIAPFGSAASNKHFWLRQIPMDGVTTGLTQATTIEANVPYLISMPNSEAYPAEFNQAGRVTFSSQNAEVPVTQLNVVEAQTGAGDMVLLQPNFKGQSATAMIYALNVGEQRDGHPEGSVFVANDRSVRPFEAFTVHHGNGPAPQFISVSAMNGDVTGIEDVRGLMSDGRGDNWYDLNGRRLQQKPTKKGIYILNGIKVVIK